MNAWKLSLSSLAILSVFTQVSPGAAQTVVLEPAADTTISRDETGESNGKGQHLFVGATNAGLLRRGLLRFDLASVPAGARVVSASLQLNASRSIAAAQTLELVPLLEGWGEGTSNADNNEGRLTAATAGDATWLMRIFPDTAWFLSGGSAGLPEASLSVSGLGLKTWTSPAMATRVEAWLADPSTNHGWLLKNTTETGAASAFRFDTREHPTLASRPKLTVTYELAPVLTDTTPGIDLFASVFVDGNGNTGFGGPVGGGRLYLDAGVDGALQLGFVRGPGNLNDVLVLYLDTAVGGAASTATYTDQGDGSRVAISGVSGNNRTTVTFPAGFRPDYAIAYDARFGAFLFRLSEGGVHAFVAQVAPASTQSAANATFTLTLAQLGLAPGDRLSLLGTYLSDNAFRSDEWFGAELAAGNPGFAPTVVPNASYVVFQTVATLCVPLDCDDEDECTVDECTATGCEHDPEARGTLCTGGFCDGAADPSCVECVDATACDDDDTCTDDRCEDGVCVSVDNGTCNVEPGPESQPEVVEPGPDADDTSDADAQSEPNPEPDPDPDPDPDTSDTSDTDVADTTEPNPEPDPDPDPDPNDTDVPDTNNPEPDPDTSDTSVGDDTDVATSDTSTPTDTADVTTSDTSTPTDAAEAEVVVKGGNDDGCASGGALAPLALLGLALIRRRRT